MVAILPSTVGQTGFVSPHTGVFGGVVTATQEVSVSGRRLQKNGLKLSIHHFLSVADADTWDLAPRRAVACAWQADDVDADLVAVTVVARVAGGRNSQIRFDAQAAGGPFTGWLWVLSQS